MNIQELIATFSSYTRALVTRRQTTFFDIECEQLLAGNKRKFLRVHYDHKHEVNVQNRLFKSLSHETDHPLLLEYTEHIYPVQLVSEVKDKVCFLEQLSEAAADVFGIWRPANAYCFIPPQNFIERSYGILMEAPRSYVDAVISRAATCGVTLIAGKAQNPREPSAKVLLMDEMYVIADGFRVEQLD
jgi:hypothetical protein